MVQRSSFLSFYLTASRRGLVEEGMIPRVPATRFRTTHSVFGSATPPVGRLPLPSFAAQSLDCEHGDMARLGRDGMGPNHDFDILIQRSQELHQLLDGELIETIVL